LVGGPLGNHPHNRKKIYKKFCNKKIPLIFVILKIKIMGQYKRVSGIYVITNILNNKKYVGYSMNINKRWDAHKHHLRRNTSKNTHLQGAWNEYKERSFVFSILEIMPDNLSKQEYEEVETKWVLRFKSHESAYGYNSVLPGSVPLYRQEENIKRGSSKGYKCIDASGVIYSVSNRNEAYSLSGIKETVVTDLAGYWRDGLTKKKRKSRYGWIIVPSDVYDESFDYINYKKKRVFKGVKKPKELRYVQKYIKKRPEDIIPREKRNLKRVSILAKNIITGDEKIYPMIKDSYNEFLSSKVHRCINNEFGKYTHRGHHFRRL
jgi:group I intron endonuclease